MKEAFFYKHKLLISASIIFVVAIVAIFVLIDLPSSNDSNTLPATVSANDITTPPASPLSPPPVVVSPIQVSPAQNATIVELPGPDEIQQKYRVGIEFYEQGKYDEAIEIFNELIVQNPLNPFVFNARGTVYTSLKQYNQALDDYSAAIKIDPNLAQSYYNRGRIYSFLEMETEAISDLQKSIELEINEYGYRANGNIGLIYHQLGEYDNALEAFAESISYNTEEKADVYYFRGETYAALENYEAAIADYQAAIERFSEFDQAYQGLGYAYYKTGQFGKALESLNQALQILPNSPITNFYLALVYVNMDQFDNAESTVSKAMNSLNTLSEDDRDFITMRILTQLEALSQKQPGKAEAIDRIIKLLPTSQ